MRVLDCAELNDVAAELAAGLLCGEERSAAIAHLATCPACEYEVAALAMVTDRLLLLAPWTEPRAGFEQRVLAAILAEQSNAPQRAPRLRRLSAKPAIAAAAVLLFAAGIVLIGISAPADPAIARADMRTPQGAVLGRVELLDDDPTLLSIALPDWSQQDGYAPPGDNHVVVVATDDGRQFRYRVPLSADTSWSSTIDGSIDSISSVSIIDDTGRVWCSAVFA